jgi:hypothetical protein
MTVKKGEFDSFGLADALDSLSSFVNDDDEILASTPLLQGHEYSEFLTEDLLREKSPNLEAFDILRKDISDWYSNESKEKGNDST